MVMMQEWRKISWSPSAAQSARRNGLLHPSPVHSSRAKVMFLSVSPGILFTYSSQDSSKASIRTHRAAGRGGEACGAWRLCLSRKALHPKPRFLWWDRPPSRHRQTGYVSGCSVRSTCDRAAIPRNPTTLHGDLWEPPFDRRAPLR
jgi:hypothetical protein